MVSLIPEHRAQGDLSPIGGTPPPGEPGDEVFDEGEGGGGEEGSDSEVKPLTLNPEP